MLTRTGVIWMLMPITIKDRTIRWPNRFDMKIQSPRCCKFGACSCLWFACNTLTAIKTCRQRQRNGYEFH